MKTSFRSILLLVLTSSIFVSSAYARKIMPPAGQAETSDEDKTLSPYFLVKSEDGIEKFPLKSTSAEVNIAGVIADVKVTQVYKNEGDKTIEAIYVFPASTKAAVYGMKMTIGERTIVAKVKEREQARKDYEKAKQEGKTASLLEQQRPNVFQMSVANILPKDVVKVELKYTELLVPEDATYEFVYPTVVGPRYSNMKESKAPKSEGWVKNPYLHEGEKPNYIFDIKTEISAGLPINEITCTSHKINVNFDGKADAIIKLDPAEKHGGNRDFILKYRLAGGKIESGLLLYEGKDENFFLTMIQPPARVSSKDIPPREYIFIVDISGSMRGFPLDISKKLLKDLIGNLRKTDVFNVLLFAGGSTVMSEKSLPATSGNITKAIDVIDRQRGGGGTELLPALKRALALPKSEGFSRSVVIVTDGYVRVEEEAFDLIRKNLGRANMFAFGIGTGVNRFIIEGMARVGMGEPFVITKPDEAPSKAEKFRELIQSPVLTQINMKYPGFKTYDIEPPSIPDVLAQRPVIVFGKYKGKPKGNIRLEGYSGKKKFKTSIDVSSIKTSPTNSAIKYLWARHKIALLSDYNKLRPNDERKKEVTNLGLKYNLLTAYTSFVAIDSKVRAKDGSTTVKQPLPLPQGVSDYAVGYGGAGLHKTIPMGMPYKGGGNMMFQRSISNGAVSRAVDKAAEEKAHKPAKLAIKNVKIDGKLDRAAIEKSFKVHLHSLRKCLKPKGKSRPGGEIVVELILKGRRPFFGKSVKSVKILKITLSGVDLDKDCFIKKLKKIRFKDPEDGKTAKITVTFSF